MAFLISCEQGFRTVEDYQAFFAEADDDAITTLIAEMRMFTALADVALRMILPEDTLPRIEELGLRPDDGFKLTAAELQNVLFEAVDGQDNADVDRLMSALSAEHNPHGPEALDYLERSGWWLQSSGDWYDSDTRVELPPAKAVASQLEREGPLLMNYQLQRTYNVHLAKLSGDRRRKEGHYNELDALMAAKSKRNELMIDLNLVGGPKELNGATVEITGTSTSVNIPPQADRRRVP
jgi:hypothetical protein